MSVPYTDSEASEARQWSNRYGPPNAWTASFGTAARMIGRLLDERERLMAKQTVAAPGDDYIREWHDEFQRWKAVADAKQELRDQFAAAALNALLARRDCYDHEVAVLAWDMADAMLRCRGSGDCPGPDNAPNLDAAPAARAQVDAAGISRQGTGDTPVTEPMPVVASGIGSVTPAGNNAEPDRKQQPALTDAERDAIALFAATAWSGLRWSEVEKHAAVLSGLLERTK